jgi:hypothetical protein
VAALLTIHHVAGLLQRSDELPARDDGKPGQLLDLDNLFGYRRRHRVAVSLEAF